MKIEIGIYRFIVYCHKSLLIEMFGDRKNNLNVYSFYILN